MNAGNRIREIHFLNEGKSNGNRYKTIKAGNGLN